MTELRGSSGQGARGERDQVFKWRRAFERGELSEPAASVTDLRAGSGPLAPWNQTSNVPLILLRSAALSQLL
jgi:hypothetical protein